MSNTTNDNTDKELDDYLSGDTQYSKRYRAISADAVPTEMDRLVLAQATATAVTPLEVAIDKRVTTKRRTQPLSFWMRVGAPVAIAASFVFAISVMLDSGVRYDSAPSFNSEVSAEADSVSTPMEELAEREEKLLSPAPMNSVQDRFASESRANESREKATAQRELTREAQARSAPAVSVPAAKPRIESFAVPATAPVVQELKKESAAPAAGIASPPAVAARSRAMEANTANQLDQVVVTGRNVRSSAEDSAMPVDVVSAEQLDKTSDLDKAGPRSTIPSSSFAKQALSDADIAKQEREDDPAAWLVYIRELRVKNNARAADEEWKRFVKSYPNYSVDQGDNARPMK